MSTQSAAARAFRAGRLSDSLRLLQESEEDTPANAVLLSELLYLTGSSKRARFVATQWLDDAGGSISTAERARLLGTLAACCVDDSDLRAASIHGRQALALSEESKESPLIALAARSAARAHLR